MCKEKKKIKKTRDESQNNILLYVFFDYEIPTTKIDVTIGNNNKNNYNVCMAGWRQVVVTFADSAGTVAKKRFYSVVVLPEDPYHRRCKTLLVCRQAPVQPYQYIVYDSFIIIIIFRYIFFMVVKYQNIQHHVHRYEYLYTYNIIRHYKQDCCFLAIFISPAAPQCFVCIYITFFSYRLLHNVWKRVTSTRLQSSKFRTDGYLQLVATYYIVLTNYHRRSAGTTVNSRRAARPPYI